MEAKTKHKWHFNPEFSLGHILTTITLVVTFSAYIHKMDNRQSVFEARLEIAEKALDEIKAQTDREIQRLWARVDMRLNRIDRKLDDIIKEGKR